MAKLSMENNYVNLFGSFGFALTEEGLHLETQKSCSFRLMHEFTLAWSSWYNSVSHEFLPHQPYPPYFAPSKKEFGKKKESIKVGATVFLEGIQK